MNVALAIIGLTLLAAIAAGVMARPKARMNLEQWSIGNRGFGAFIVFILMAGEIYTTFTFLGASGFAYGHGGSSYYIISYTCLAFVMSFWTLPPIWRYAKERKLLTQPDFFKEKYQSEGLGALVAAIGLIAIVPYLVLQLKGLGVIVELASYGAISTSLAVWIGAVAMTIYVIVSGVHGSAWTSTVKDALILIVVTFLGIYVPIHYYGSWSGMFQALEEAKPGFLALQARGFGPAWYCSTIFISSLGLYMWPHTFASIYTSKSEDTFRRNSIIMPLYALVMVLSMIVGMAAVLKLPGLSGGQIDLALLKLSIRTFDPWFVGIIGAAGLLTAIVPGSMMLISASTLVANNIYGKLHADAPPERLSLVAKLGVPGFTLVAVFFTLRGNESIVGLLIMAYGLVTQLSPALLCSLSPNNPINRYGAGAGIVVGVTAIAVTVLTKSTLASLFPGLPDWAHDINVGVLALALNIVTMISVSVLTERVGELRRRSAGAPHGAQEAVQRVAEDLRPL